MQWHGEHSEKLGHSIVAAVKVAPEQQQCSVAAHQAVLLRQVQRAAIASCAAAAAVPEDAALAAWETRNC